MRAADLRLDLANQCLWRGRDRLDLPPKSFQVLALLAAHPGTLVTKSELLARAWADTVVGDAVLTVAVKQIRDLVGDDARQPWLIETVHRRGFRLLHPLAGVERPFDAPGPPTLPPAASDGAASLGRRGLVGRDAALSRLQSAWRDALTGERQIVFVTGEPGIGKTSLIDSFVTGLSPDPEAMVGRGQCLETYGSAEAYLPVLEAIEGLLEGSDSSPFAAVLRRCAPNWVAQFPFLATESGSTPAIELRGASRERLLREVATALEMQSVQRPVLLVIEDLHWSDPSTITLLFHFCQRRQPARVMVVASYRPVDVVLAEQTVKDVKTRLVTTGHGVEVPLSYLDESDVRAFLESRLSGRVGADAVSLVHQRCNGNPLFMTNLLEHLVRKGALRERDGVWHAVASPDVEVPARLLDVVEQSVRRCSEEEVDVLEAGSVAGSSFASAALAAVLDRDPVAVEELCAGLARRGDLLRTSGTTRLEGDVWSGRYEFVHAMVHNALYQRIAPLQRLEAHRRLGMWGERSGAPLGELAHHFAAAGTVDVADKAIGYCSAAAVRAREVFAYGEAVQHSQAALQTLRQHFPSDTPRECELELALAEAMQRCGRIAEPEALFRDVVRKARGLGAARLLARAAIGIAHGYERIETPEQALIALLEEALARLENGDPALRALLLGLLGYNLGGLPDTDHRRDKAAAEARRLAGQIDDLAAAWVHQYTQWTAHGPHDTASRRARLRTIATLLDRAVQAEPILVARHVLAAELLDLGEMERATAVIDALDHGAEEAQFFRVLWWVLRMRSNLALLRGDFAEAEVWFQRTLEKGQAGENPRLLALYAAQLALTRVEQGRWDELLSLMEGSLDRSHADATWRSGWAYLLCRLGRTDEARLELEQMAADGFAAVRRDSTWLLFMTFTAAVCRDLGDAASAALLYEQLLPYRELYTGATCSVLFVGSTERALGLLAEACGRVARASEHFTAAVDKNEAIGALPWAVLSRLDYARFLLDQGTSASRKQALQLVQAALATAQRLGMDGWLDSLRQVQEAAQETAPTTRTARRPSRSRRR